MANREIEISDAVVEAAWSEFFSRKIARTHFEAMRAAITAAIKADREGDARVLAEGVYTASKTRHALIWRNLRDSGIPIISTWIDEAGEGESGDLNDLWERCISESMRCKVMIIYRHETDALKGAWVELGAALAAGVPHILAVGLEGFTIAKSKRITHFNDLDAAIDVARALLAEGESAPPPPPSALYR